MEMFVGKCMQQNVDEILNNSGLKVPPWGDLYMIDNCLDGDTRLAAMCHRQPVDDKDYTYLMDLPVLSLETNVTYANIFCAQCHQDVARLAKWDAEIACKVPVNK